MSGRLGSGLAALILLLLAGASLRPLAPLPKLGPFLDPVHGAWSVARQATLPADASARIPGLTGPVDVRYDRRAVPHIFAGNELDAIRALGYVVARDRLFQLELQARAGAGTLTELVGPRALPLDREIRGLGLPDAAERRDRAEGDSTPAARRRVAYAEGINAWIDQLGRADLPLEYHLLGARPRRWERVDVLHLLGRMGWTLAVSDLEAAHDAAAARVGRAAADAIYPRNSPIQEPIQPNGRRAAQETAGRIPPPGVPDATENLALGCHARCAAVGWDDALGSNNWAVAPARTARGHALLAGDPHLELTLPSIWYEVHLVVADSLDVYGVTIPGAAGVVIGFNRDVAWTFTNTEADVMDRYREAVDDSLSPTRYRLDGDWRPLRLRVERYRGADGVVIASDTLRFSHRGPVDRSRDGRWYSTRWTVLEAGDEIEALGQAVRAASAGEWLARMEHWEAPAQNLLVADRGGHIAIRSTGRFPRRPTDRGDVTQPGEQAADDWTGDWGLSQMPQALDPAQGYLASANQQPVDPAVDGRYLGANWYSPWRALRINQLLRADSQVTVDDMRRFQTDPGSAAADRFVPAFLAAAAIEPKRDSLAKVAALLAEWDRRYTLDNSRAVLYEAAIGQLQRRLWDELAGAGRSRAGAPTPGLVVTWELLADPHNAWWDDRRTSGVVEDRDRLLNDALLAGYADVVRAYGAPSGDGWRWDRVRHANVYHLLRIPALSALGVPVQGGSGTLNPSSGDGAFGPSWRMVVELGTPLRAWGIYPGGQSGNPASSRYLDRLPRWQAGTLDSLEVPATPDAVSQPGAVLRLLPEGARAR